MNRDPKPAIDADAGTTLPRALGWIAVAVIALSVSYALHLERGLLGDDDTLYHYATGLAVFRTDEVRSLNDDVAAWLAAHAQDHAAKRWSQRVLYERNYLLTSVVLYAAGRWVGPTSHASYLDYLNVALPLGFVAMFATTLLVVTVGLASMGRSRIAGCVAGAVVLDLAFRVVVEQPGPYRIIVPGEALASARNLLVFLLKPEGAFVIFGHTPRNLFALLMLLVFAWRLRGRYGASYWVVAGASFVHQGYAGLAVAALAAIDLVRRPRVLLEWRVALPVAVATSLFLARDGLVFRFLDPGVAALAGAGALAAGFAWLRRRTAQTRHDRHDRHDRRERRTSAGDGMGDLALLLLAVVATAVFAFLVGPSSDPFDREIFWFELPGRLGAILRPGILLLAVHGATTALRDRLPSAVRGRPLARALPGLAVVATVVTAGLVYVREGRLGTPALRSSLADVERSVPEFGPRQPLQLRESVLYLTMDRTVDLGDGSLPALLGRSPPGPHEVAQSP